MEITPLLVIDLEKVCTQTIILDGVPEVFSNNLTPTSRLFVSSVSERMVFIKFSWRDSQPDLCLPAFLLSTEAQQKLCRGVKRKASWV